MDTALHISLTKKVCYIKLSNKILWSVRIKTVMLGWKRRACTTHYHKIVKNLKYKSLTFHLITWERALLAIVNVTKNFKGVSLMVSYIFCVLFIFLEIYCSNCLWTLKYLLSGSNKSFCPRSWFQFLPRYSAACPSFSPFCSLTILIQSISSWNRVILSQSHERYFYAHRWFLNLSNFYLGLNRAS